MTRTVLVCVIVDCKDRGSEEVLGRLCAAVEANDCDADVREYLCFSACEKGPHVVVVEDRVSYAGVQADDVDEVTTKHLENGETVERLSGRPTPSPARTELRTRLGTLGVKLTDDVVAALEGG